MSRRNSKRWVYLIGSTETRPVKIGVANDPAGRLADLQIGSPVRLHIMWQTRGATKLEHALHAYFAPYRLHGEWFDFEDENPAALVATAAVLLGHRAQPERVDVADRYQVSACGGCAGMYVRRALVVPRKPVKANQRVPAQRALPVVKPPTALTDNQSAVLRTVRDGATTNAEISKLTGLNPGSVARAVDALIKRDLLVKVGTEIRLGSAA